MKIVDRLGVLLVGACVLAAGCGTVSPSGSDGGGGTGGSSSDGSGTGGRGGAGGTAGAGGTGGCAPGQVWCPGCTPGTGACYSGGCPGVACPPPDAGTCDQVTTQVECDTRSDCHSVFTDPGTCGCASVGCCAHFSRCAPGDHGRCTQPSTFGCAIATPFCESPVFVVSYTSNCYEGCVHADDCAP